MVEDLEGHGAETQSDRTSRRFGSFLISALALDSLFFVSLRSLSDPVVLLERKR
jgi:hypothetical protein